MTDSPPATPKSRRRPKSPGLPFERWSLHEGDCRLWLPTLPDKSVDHVITDPPYSDHVHKNARAGVRKVPLSGGKGAHGCDARRGIDRGIDFGFDAVTPSLITDCAEQFARICKRWCLVFSDVESCHLWREALTAAGMRYVRTLSWDRMSGAPQFSGDRPAAAFDVITLCHAKSARCRWNAGGKRGIYHHAPEMNHGVTKSRYHPTAKPLSLMVELLEDFTDPDELVCDPFSGSSTTGAACLRLGRRFVGCERSPEWAETSRKRLAAEASLLSLNAANAGQVPLFAATTTT